jgi:hypothetical protein
VGSNPTERSATVSDYRSLQTCSLEKSASLRSWRNGSLSRLSHGRFCDLHGCNQGVGKRPIRQLWVLENVGSIPTALTEFFIAWTSLEWSRASEARERRFKSYRGDSQAGSSRTPNGSDRRLEKTANLATRNAVDAFGDRSTAQAAWL